MRTLHVLKDFVERYASMRKAGTELGVSVQTLSYILKHVPTQTFVLENEDGTYMLLREVKTKEKGA